MTLYQIQKVPLKKVKQGDSLRERAKRTVNTLERLRSALINVFVSILFGWPIFFFLHSVLI